MLNYLRWSNISFQIDLNPFGWSVYCKHSHNESGIDPKWHSIVIRLLMFKLVIDIDDGSW